MERLLLVLAGMCLLTCSPFTRLYPGTTDPRTHAYVNVPLGVSVSVPNGWPVLTGSLSEASTRQLFARDPMSMMLVGTTSANRRVFARVLVFGEDYSLSEAVKILAGRLVADGATLSAARWVVAGCDSAALLEYTVNRGGARFKYSEVLLRRPLRVVRLQFWTLSALYGDYEGFFRDLVRTTALRDSGTEWRTPWRSPEVLLSGQGIAGVRVTDPSVLGSEYGEPCPDSGRSMLWRIRSQTNTVYILGSIHVAKPELYPLSAAIEHAFESSSVLVVEVDAESDASKRVVSKLMRESRYPLGVSIKDSISAPVYASLSRVLSDLGMPISYYGALRPWVLGNMLTMMKLSKMGITPEYGLDYHFLKRARTGPNRKEVRELERMEEHAKMLMECTDNELFLAHELFDIDKTESQLVPMIAAWKCGNTRLFEQLVLTGDLSVHPEFVEVNEKLVYKRNELFAQLIRTYLNENRDYFVVFGCGHAVGDRGVPALLSQSGFSVEQL